MSTTNKAVSHPAKWSDSVLDAIAPIIRADFTSEMLSYAICDPFAGVGKILRLGTMVDGIYIVGLELEREWAAPNLGLYCGDALNPPW